MTYRRRSAPRRTRAAGTSSLAWVWLFLGMIIGIAGSFFSYSIYIKYLSDNKPHPQFKIQALRHTHSASSARASQAGYAAKNLSKEKSAKESSAQYEFYTLLPGMEVQLPDIPEKSLPKTVQNVTTHQQPQQLTTAAPHQIQRQTAPPVQVATPAKMPMQVVVVPQTQAVQNPVTRPAVTHAQAHAQAQPHAHTQGQPHVQAQQPTAAQPPVAVQQNLAAAQFIIQVGVYRELKKADVMKNRLVAQGFAPHIQKVQTQNRPGWFRVTLGPFPSEKIAQQHKKRLEKQKIRGILILQRSTAR